MNEAMNNSKMSCAGQAIRAEGTAAEEIMNQLLRAAAQCEETVSRAQDKLFPLCRPLSPEIQKEKTVNLRREYPPYFEDIRKHLDTIEAATARLSNTIDRMDF